MALTEKQLLFVEEYARDRNGTRAYREAYKGTCKSDAAASAGASRLLANVKVAAAVREAVAARSRLAELSAADVLAGLRREAEREGDGSSPSARVKAWELLGKHLGMFRDREPLDALLGSLPPDLGGEVREALARLLSPGGGRGGGGEQPHPVRD